MIQSDDNVKVVSRLHCRLQELESPWEAYSAKQAVLIERLNAELLWYRSHVSFLEKQRTRRAVVFVLTVIACSVLWIMFK